MTQNEKGIAFIMTLIVLVVVGTLAAMLLRASNTHIDLALHEEARSKAFHSAEAGVEFIRAHKSKIANNIENKIEEDGNNINNFRDIAEEYDYINAEIEFTNDEYWFDNQDFNFEIDDIEFKISLRVTKEVGFGLNSEGKYKPEGENSYYEQIKFELVEDGVWLKNFNIAQNFDPDDIEELEDHYDISGLEEEFEDNITIVNWREQYDDFEDFYKDFAEEYKPIEEDNDDWRFEQGDPYEIDSHIEEEKIFIEGNLDIKPGGKSEENNEGNTIENSVLIVEGHIDDIGAQSTIKDSVFIVKDYVSAHGVASAEEDWKNPLFLIYSEESEENFFHPRGTGEAFNIEYDDLPLEIDNDKTRLLIKIDNWQQVID